MGFGGKRKECEGCEGCEGRKGFLASRHLERVNEQARNPKQETLANLERGGNDAALDRIGCSSVITDPFHHEGHEEHEVVGLFHFGGDAEIYAAWGRELLADSGAEGVVYGDVFLGGQAFFVEREPEVG